MVPRGRYAPLEKNMQDTTMHLTNYAINKDSDAFVQPEDETDCADAHKRTISSLMTTLAEEGHDVRTLWNEIGEVCVKTIISVQPHLEHTYGTCRRKSDDAGSACFELLGFDIMMDHKLKPFLLEVNHSPSFTCDSPLDLSVKSSVLRATMEMVSPSKDEWKLMKRFPRRLPPEAREKLVELRDDYEVNNADRLGFDPLYPPGPASFEGDEEACQALLERYNGYLELGRELYNGMSVTGSRRAATNCGSKLPEREPPSSRGTFSHPVSQRGPTAVKTAACAPSAAATPSSAGAKTQANGRAPAGATRPIAPVGRAMAPAALPTRTMQGFQGAGSRMQGFQRAAHASSPSA